MLDIRQTENYARYIESVGWKSEKTNDFWYYYKTVPLFGNFIKIQRPEKLSQKTLEDILQKRAIQIVVESTKESQNTILKANGFKKTKSSYLPTKSLQLDLTRTKNKLFMGLEKDAQKAVEKNCGRKLILLEIENIKMFRTCWRKNVGYKRYVPPLKNLTALKKYFSSDSLFIVDSKKTSGAIFLIGKNRAYYWQAFTGDRGRKSLIHYKIVWKGICWAKKRGAREFDFEGVFDQRIPNRSWLGFTHFKSSFGGKVIEYPLPMTKFLVGIAK